MVEINATIGVGDPQGNKFEDLDVAVTDGARTYTEVPMSRVKHSCRSGGNYSCRFTSCSLPR